MRTTLPVVVIGAGHAGVEAAHAAARMGCDVQLLTLNRDAVVRLSCNPAIGGIGKGHLVREIDALGGLMGVAADRGGIHFRVLNASRGPAVQGPRAQQDYDRYPLIVGALLGQAGTLDLIEAEAATFWFEQGRVAGVETTDGRRFPAAAVVLTSGTFLRGRMFQGEVETPGGRVGEPASHGISAALEGAGLRIDRFKTGTPPRLEAASLDFSAFERQPGDEPPTPFSFLHLGDRFQPLLPQTITHLTKTSERVHDIVRQNLDRSPLYSGRIRALGPRYCPSFEDKVVKFSDKASHLLHLEPMGLAHPWIYVNGFSTSLPPEVQETMIRAVEGLESAVVARYGYAVEYDFVPPTQLTPWLEARALPGLFLAGQICGTTGYEEAAGLGLVAGANAARRAQGHDPWIPERRHSYLGVMVDDLTTTGVVEPYRMFTARAEARLSLSADSADRRLSDLGYRLGLVDESARVRAAERWERIDGALSCLERSTSRRGAVAPSAADEIRRGVDAATVLSASFTDGDRLSVHDESTLLGLIRYRGYLERERRELDRLGDLDKVRVPAELDFATIGGLSHEVRQRLLEVRPVSLGQASRIPGMNPAALALLAATIARVRAAS